MPKMGFAGRRRIADILLGIPERKRIRMTYGLFYDVRLIRSVVKMVGLELELASGEKPEKIRN